MNGYPWDALTCYNAAENGHLDCLEWLIEQGCPHDFYFCFFEAAINGHADVLRWVASEWTPDHDYFHPELLEEVAGNGPKTIPVLELAKEWDSNFNNAALITCAAHGGHLDNIKWLVEHGAPLEHDAIPQVAATEGNLDVLNWVAEQPDMHWDDATYDGAIQSHHVHVLEWARNTKKVHGPWAKDDLSRKVALWGNMEMAKWVVDNGFEWGEIATRTNLKMAQELAEYLEASMPSA